MRVYSNEIVFRGHPDKVCDQISDAILDDYLSHDKNSRCAIEVCGGKGMIFITGEVTSSYKSNVEKVVNDTLKDIGYDLNYEIINNLGIQSSDISMGVDTGGAGDQGMMFGYACNDNDKYLPTAMIILQELSKEYDKLTVTSMYSKKKKEYKANTAKNNIDSTNDIAFVKNKIRLTKIRKIAIYLNTLNIDDDNPLIFIKTIIL